MRVYLAPIIIIALVVAVIIFLVSCSTGFRGSLGNATPASPSVAAVAMQ